ncbi:UDP-N-acetylmuramoylalanyl-D-glutamate--2,6-diaminopimelate ligase [Pseudoalteromonas luteoviolacea B = ATCC 29581]|nr:UDP-N-acetylmuramoylalanyl-D-glutamate--2,6-diaminopimelate ligase [Pseudoalteromonas luteoviolacea B = ATCC 29581]
MRDLAAVLTHVCRQFNVAVTLPRNVPTQVNHLRLDSRVVAANDVFVALQGHQVHGAQFIEKALHNGAVAVLVNMDFIGAWQEDERVIGVPNLEAYIADIAHAFYGHPSSELTLVGVTGTNGKSTTTTMIANLAQLCGTHSAVVGTLGFGKPSQLTELPNTTPSHVELARILAQLATENKLVAMEVSSHGLSQHRVAGCQFKVGVFTNLTRDHLDYHGSMEAYGQAKRALFETFTPSVSVINFDDEYGRRCLNEIAHQRAIAVGKNSQALRQNPHFVAFDEVEYSPQGLRCKIITPTENCHIKSSLFGEFNLYNLVSAMAVLLSQGFALEQLAEVVPQLQPVTGRMQPFSAENQPTCIVDYAHTPDALKQALVALRHHVPGKLTCLFGCGGDRDKGKRAEMAKIAEQYADRIVVTSDNPRTESPSAIIEDILNGFSSKANVVVEADREKAISLAITGAEESGIVLIAGKGHEDYQIIGQDVIAFCDRSMVARYLGGNA